MAAASLADIGIGQRARVREIALSEEMCRRLMELGLTIGAEATCLYAASSGDPRAYDIRGAVIALRGRDAGGVMVEDAGHFEDGGSLEDAGSLEDGGSLEDAGGLRDAARGGMGV